MGQMLAGLLRLQSVETQRTQVRQRLRSRRRAVQAQQGEIEQLQQQQQDIRDQIRQKRKEADALELELKSREDDVSRLRLSLNSARTNKEYAGILTQINTIKADNSKLEESALSMMQEIESLNEQVGQIAQRIENENKRLENIRESNSAEVERLNEMLQDLDAKRAEAARDIPPEALATFERIAETYDGEAMAPIEVHGKKPPHTYICGGCFMTLSAEHANALQTRDEIRTCDNCGRILYLEPQQQEAPKD
ncbi:MAG: zinc ribbon domain-containing protein [Phycisphaerae bacterium]